MCRSILVGLGIIGTSTVQGQNLVKNSGFELVDCNATITTNTIHYCSDWYETDSTATIDIFHGCFSEVEFNPPSAGNAYGLTHSGEGMAGFVPITRQGDNWREVMSITLSDTLMKDSIYYVSLYVLNGKNYQKDYAVDQIGVLFTTDTITLQQTRTQNANIKSEAGVFLEAESWTKIEGLYFAKGGEKFLNIGSFGQNVDWYFNGAQYDISGLPMNLYYFVDDVTVLPCNRDSVLNISLDLPNVFTPNGDKINDLYSIHHQNITSMKVVIYNRWGARVIEYDGLNKIWDGTTESGEQVPDGVYFACVIATDRLDNTIFRSQTVTVEH